MLIGSYATVVHAFTALSGLVQPQVTSVRNVSDCSMCVPCCVLIAVRYVPARHVGLRPVWPPEHPSCAGWALHLCHTGVSVCWSVHHNT